MPSRAVGKKRVQPSRGIDEVSYSLFRHHLWPDGYIGLLSPGVAASVPEDLLNSNDPLPVQGFRGTPEEIERQWYEQVYRGRGDRMAQLTWRAVLMGSLLGGVLSITNLYIGLQAGWGLGVAITACIL